MLNKETKDRINRTRNILVGQLPLPSDQVELITIALIYKFMDDIDEESRKLGGEVSFFRNGLSDYAWNKLLSNQLAGEERVLKFIEAIEAITKAPHIPELFKSIFRNTFLKFRDPRVLKLFLDEINGFKYDHSEELGNAFEFLLNSMGSQGENGQFRTPRNIIDFIVEVVDPGKEDKILDPACGTAGFLISAYKHILRKYTKGYEDYRISLNNYEIEGVSIQWGDKLNVIDKDNLTKRIEGYDITPLMVRLSQVNMYLHHFPNPLIHDYDTLSNKNRWDDKYDCIFANPPFMTPKGGVETHDQFRIRAKKAEILFSDYIIEHLTPNGKAGWIVPEGIIFQGSNDYVKLRKWLVESMGLWAVVSIPAHIFQPYSGVKTSILFVDRALARSTDNIILVKVENDGFSLNTNRNPIKENDLPDALNLLMDYKNLAASLSGRLAKSEEKLDELAAKYHVKFKVLNRKEFAKLDSYKAVASTVNFCKREFKKFLKAKEKYEESYNKAEDEKQKQRALNTFQKQKELFIEVTGFETIPFDEGMIKERVNEKLKDDAVKYGEDRNNLVKLSHELLKYLDDQREYNLSGEKRFAVGNVHNQKYDFIKIGELAKTTSGGTPSRNNAEYYKDGKIPWLKSGEVSQGSIFSSQEFITDEGLKKSSAKIVPQNSVLIALYGATAGKVGLLKFDSAINQAICAILPNEKFNSDYLYYILSIKTKEFVKLSTGGAQQNLSQGLVQETEIPLPPPEGQQKIVDEIDGYQKVIDGCNLVINNYKPQIKVDQSWPLVELGNLCEVKGGKRLPKGETFSESATKHPYIRVTDFRNYTIDKSNLKYISENLFNEISRYTISYEDVYLSIAGTTGLFGIVPKDLDCANLTENAAKLIVDKNKLNKDYLAYIGMTDVIQSQIKKLTHAVGVPKLALDRIKTIQVPLPTLEQQKEIVEKISSQYNSVKDLNVLKTQMEQKIKEVIDGVWGKIH